MGSKQAVPAQRDHKHPTHRQSALALALAFCAPLYTQWSLAQDESAVEPASEQPQSLSAQDLDEFTPYTPYGRQFALMREELTRYSALAEGDLWQPLPAGQALAAGMRNPRVTALRSLLMQYGDYALDDHTDTTGDADEYGPRLEQAVRRFQRRHGLKPDGLVDERTRARLNTLPAERARILAANIERWRNMPKDLGPRYILVNIPEFTLRLMENEREQYRMRVIVGKPVHKTPQLAARLTRVIFNPTWTVPPNIAARELLPKGSASLTAGGYRLVNNKGKTVPFTGGNMHRVRLGSVSLQQKSGPGNALGRLKFVIPNPHAIFLHDTNKKNLFGQAQRAFSHGCIRLEKPHEFARMMLANEGNWSEERIAQITSGERSRSVELKDPVPLYIAYWTAWVDEEGLLQFRPDIYGYDRPRDTAEQTGEHPAGSEESKEEDIKDNDDTDNEQAG